RFMGMVTVDVSEVHIAAMMTVEVNNTGADVNEAFMVGGSTIPLVMTAGRYVRVIANGLTVSIFGQQLSGNFFFEKGTNATGGTVIKVAVDHLNLVLGSASDPIVNIQNADGQLLITPEGVAASFELSITPDTFKLPAGISIQGDVSIQI